MMRPAGSRSWATAPTAPATPAPPWLKPGTPRSSNRRRCDPRSTAGFTLDDFTIDETADTVTCPNGLIRPITTRRNVTFGVARRGCPLRQRCTTAKTGRSLILHPHNALLRAARTDWAANPDLQATYRQHRPMVERSIAWLIGPKGRCRQLRYRGVAANDLWLHHRMAALNLRRLLNLGLHRRHNNAWAVA